MWIFKEKEGYLKEKFTEVSIPLEGTLSQVFLKNSLLTQNNCGLPNSFYFFLYISKSRSFFMFVLCKSDKICQ